MPNENQSRSIPLLMSDEEFEQIATKQRLYINALADRLNSGAHLSDEHERGIVVLALQRLAESIPLMQKGKQGPPPKMCPGSEALSYAAHRIISGMSHGKALAEIADRLGISEVAVAKGIKPYRQAAFAFFSAKDPGNRAQKQPK